MLQQQGSVAGQRPYSLKSLKYLPSGPWQRSVLTLEIDDDDDDGGGDDDTVIVLCVPESRCSKLFTHGGKDLATTHLPSLALSN